MKWNLKKVLALSGALDLIGGLAWFSNALNGNPISKMLAQSTAERYLAEHYGIRITISTASRIILRMAIIMPSSAHPPVWIRPSRFPSPCWALCREIPMTMS